MERRGSRLSRRAFVGAAGLGLVAGCGRLPWQAQQPPRVPRVGYLALGTGQLESFRAGLRDHGYVDGQNIALEPRLADGDSEQFAPLAAELIALPVDVLVTAGQATYAAIAATTTTPIVAVVDEARESEIGVTSLGQPGGNVTGTVTMAAQLSGKRLELLQEAYPRAALVGAFWGPNVPGMVVQRQRTETAAAMLGLRMLSLVVETGGDLDRAEGAALEGGIDTLFVAEHPLMYRHRLRIIDFAARNRLPATYPARGFALDGGLMTYGPDTAAIFRRAAYYVDRILKGAKPADLPVEQPMRFDFVVNLKTAQALGITFPNEIMLQVTEVVQ